MQLHPPVLISCTAVLHSNKSKSKIMFGHNASPPISSTFTTPFQQPINCHLQGHLLHTGIHQSTLCRSIHSSLHGGSSPSTPLITQTQCANHAPLETNFYHQHHRISNRHQFQYLYICLYIHVPGPPSHTTPHFTRFGQSVHSAA